MKQEAMPLKMIRVDASLMQWELNVICPTNPKFSQGHSYILTTIDYFTKWKEVKALKTTNTKELLILL